MLAIQVVGPMLVEVDGTAVSVPPRSRPQRLFCYLLIHHNQNLDRSQVAGTLWPELPESTARRRLSDSLYVLKKSLPEKVLHSDSHTLGLHFGKEDRCDYLDLNGEDLPKTALTLNPDQLFQDLDDDWAITARQGFRNALMAMLEDQGRQALAQGNPVQALPYLRRMVELDALGEAGVARLMEGLKQNNQNPEALKVFSTYCELLQKELQAEPGVNLKALAEALESPHSDRSEQRALAQDLPLIGRSEQHKMLTSLLDGSLQGRGTIVLVEGEPGIGKSRLLEEFIKDAHWRNLQVGQGRPRQGQLLAPALESLLTPLKAEHVASTMAKVWLERLVLCLPEASSLFSDVTPPKQDLAPDVQGETLRRLLVCLAQLGPMVLVLEDMHRASVDSLAQLKFLAPFLAQSKVLVALSYRPGPVRDDPEMWQALQALDSLTVTHRMELPPLSEQTTGELFQAALGPTGGQTVARLFRISGGNPLVFLEQAAALLEQGSLVQAQQGWDLKKGATDHLVSGQAKSAIKLRLASLDPSALELLLFSAVDRAPIGFGFLCALSGKNQSQVLELAQLLVHRRLWREQGTGFSPAHDLIRDALLEDLGPAGQKTLHANFLDHLDPEKESAERLGFHAFAAQLWQQAVDYLEKASFFLRRQGHYHSAREQMGQAIQALANSPQQDDANRTLRLLFEHQRLCAFTGRTEQQEKDLNTMTTLAKASPEQGPLLAWAKADWVLERGQLKEALELVRQGLEQTYISDHPLAESHLHRLGAKVAQSFGDREGILFHLPKAEQISQQHGFVEVQLAAATIRAIFHHYSGELIQARDKYCSIQNLAEDHGLVLQSIDALANQGSIEQALGHEMAAIQAIEEAIQRYRDYAVRDPKDLDNLAFLYQFVGNVEGAHQTLLESRELWLQKNDQAGLASNLCMQGYLALEQRALTKADPLLEEALRLGQEVKFLQATGTTQLNMGVSAMEQGQLEQAALLLANCHQEFHHLQATFYDGYVWSLRALAEIRAGSEKNALAFYQKAGQQIDTTLQAMRTRYYLGQVAWALGRTGEAEKWFRSAGETLQEKADSLPVGVRQDFLKMPRNECLELAVKRLENPGQVHQLAFCGAPTGRSLKPFEQVPVWWPNQEQLKQAGFSQRTDQILELFRLAQVQEAGIAVTDLASVLEVSHPTISRDLKKLRQTGSILPTRGS